MSNYSYFRSDIKVKILIKSAMAIFGYLRVASVYGKPLDWLVNQHELNSSDQYLMGLASSESMELIIPYRSDRPYLLTDAVGAGYYHSLYFHLDAQHALDGLPQIGIQVIAQFVNPKFAGPSCVQIQSDFRFKNGAQTAQYMADLASSASPFIAAGVQIAKSYVNSGSSNPEGGPIKGTPETDADKSATGVKQSLFGNLSGTAQSTSNRLGTHQSTPDMSKLIGEQQEYMLTDLAKIPCLIDWGTVTAEGVVLDYSNIRAHITWLSYLLRFFRLSAGSVKISVHFFTSPMVVARYSVTNSYSSNNEIPEPTNFEGPSANFLIRNDEIKEFIIPYHAHMNMSAGHVPHWKNYNRFKLSCTQAPNQPSSNLGGTHKYLVYMSGCDDFVFASPRHPLERVPARLLPVEDEEYEVQSSVRQLHSDNSGINFADHPTEITFPCSPTRTVAELMRIWDDRSSASDSDISPSLPVDIFTSQLAFDGKSIFDQIGVLFYLSTGAVEFKVGLLMEQADPNELYGFTLNSTLDPGKPTTDQRTGNGQYLNQSGVWPVAEFTVPYVSGNAVQPFPWDDYFAHRLGVNVNYPIGAVNKVLIRAGNDYQVFMPQILPPKALWQDWWN